MNLFALTPLEQTAGQIAAAAVLGAFGVFFLLPKPLGRVVPLGIFLSIAGLVSGVIVVVNSFGKPSADVLGQVLFWVFSAGAIGFGTVLVVQRNPARGAIGFAFVILSTCGLFLLLAAPFLMAATIIIYAGAIIVTFLFVLMLSHANGPSAENDRTREPLLGSLAGFAFAGLVLFTLYLGASPAHADSPLPAQPLTAADKASLASAAGFLSQAAQAEKIDYFEPNEQSARRFLTEVVGSTPGEILPGDPPPMRKTVSERLQPMIRDPRVWTILDQAERIRQKKKALHAELETAQLDGKHDLSKAKAKARDLRDEVVAFSGRGELPARNVTSIGFSLYSEHLLAVEFAGTLLLVATIGAVAIASRRKGAPA